MKNLIVVIIALEIASIQGGAPYGGGEMYTHETFLYGRFEVRMKSGAGGDGIVSSFFLYNLDLPCDDGLSEVQGDPSR